MMKKYEKLTELLGAGRENARKSAELAEELGTDLREVRALAEAARLSGVVVVASGDGLFLAETPEEAEKWLRTAEKKAKTQMKNLRAARKFVREYRDRQSGQLSLADIDNNPRRKRQ